MKARILFSMLLLLLLNSCNVEKRLARKQAKWCSNITKTDTIREIEHDTIYKESIKTIKLAPNPDTLNLYAIAYCDSMNNVQMPEIIVDDNSNGHKATISITNNEVKAEIICNMDSLEQIIIEKNTIIKNLESQYVTKTKVLTKIKKVGTFYVWFFWIFVVLVVVSTSLYLVWKYYSSKFKSVSTITNLIN